MLQVTTVPDEGENSFKMPRASVVHMTSTATRPQHMSQVSILLFLSAYPNCYILLFIRSERNDSMDTLELLFFFLM